MLSRFLILSCLAVTLVWAGPAEPVRKPLTAAVLDLQARGVKVEEAQVLSDRFRVELFQLKNFRLLEREKVDEILKEQGFQKSGACEQSECAVEVGKLLGVNRMIIGTVSHIGTTWTVTARVVNVETGEILQTAVQDQKGEIDALLQPGMADLAERLMESTEESGAETASVAKPAGSTSKPSKTPKAGESVIPMPDFSRPFKQMGKSDGRTSSVFQLGLVPGLQLVEEGHTVNGIAVSLPWSRSANINGLQAGVVNQVGQRMDGIQAGVVNLGETVSFLQAGTVNQARSLSGFQVGTLNLSEDTKGLQVGLLNYSRNLRGVQVGFINIATKGGLLPIMPFVNLSATR
ncbi:MAG: hypothetical protein RL318_2911 [Fibrobacterota bacterium]|jgi:hypothetical protein